MKISPMGKSLPFPKDLHFRGGTFYHENLVPVPSPDSTSRPAYLGSPLRETLLCFGSAHPVSPSPGGFLPRWGHPVGQMQSQLGS